MPRTCLACSHPEREAIDKALVAGEPLRNISKRVSISPAALVRHKSHVAGAIAKAQERREEKLGDTIFDEIRRLHAKALELLAKMESQGDYRGAIVALREARECLISANGLLVKAEGSVGVAITVHHVGSVPAIDRLERPIEIEAVSTPSNGDEAAPVVPVPSEEAEREPAQNHRSNSAVTPSGQAQSSPQPSSSTVSPLPVSQSKGFAIMPPEPPRRGIPLTRTGAAMAFLRGGGSR